tara:strand:- start:27 stop:608 length:582 start_codon:yes stop_codon:yes gene_type:complete
MTTTISGSTGVNKITDGTIDGSDFASGVRGKYVLEDNSRFFYTALTSTSVGGLTELNISGSLYATITTGSSTADLITFEQDFGNIFFSNVNSYMGYGLQRATNANFTTGKTTVWSTGEHANGTTGAENCYEGRANVTNTRTAAEWGLSANTTYYFRLIGMTHATTGTWYWGNPTASHTNGAGVKLSVSLWRLL